MLVKQVQTCGAISVDLGDLGLDVAVVEWSTNVLEQFDCFTEVLDSLLVRLLAELVVTLILESSELLFKLGEICAATSCCWCGCRFLNYSRLFNFLSLRSTRLVLNNFFSLGLSGRFLDFLRGCHRCCWGRFSCFGTLFIWSWLELAEIGQRDVIVGGHVQLTRVLLVELLAPLDALLGLLVHWL